MSRWPNTITDKFDRHWIPEPNSGCYLWIGMQNELGYGIVVINSKRVRAHRIAYERQNGKIPYGLGIDHLCNNKSCVNPEHLQVSTNSDNTRRYFSTITHCKSGHEFTEANTRIRPNGTRACRECARILGRRYHWNNRDRVLKQMKDRYNRNKESIK